MSGSRLSAARYWEAWATSWSHAWAASGAQVGRGPSAATAHSGWRPTARSVRWSRSPARAAATMRWRAMCRAWLLTQVSASASCWALLLRVVSAFWWSRRAGCRALLAVRSSCSRAGWFRHRDGRQIPVWSSSLSCPAAATTRARAVESSARATSRLIVARVCAIRAASSWATLAGMLRPCRSCCSARSSASSGLDRSPAAGVSIGGGASGSVGGEATSGGGAADGGTWGLSGIGTGLHVKGGVSFPWLWDAAA